MSDIALKRELPPELGDDLMAYVGCIAGAVLIDDYRRDLLAAGFLHVEVLDTGSDLNAYAKVENQAVCCPPPTSILSGLTVVEASCCSPTSTDESLHARLADLLRRYDVNDYAASVKVFAVKPEKSREESLKTHHRRGDKSNPR